MDLSAASDSGSSLSSGAIAGIAVGAAVVGLCLIAVGIFFWRKKKRTNSSTSKTPYAGVEFSPVEKDTNGPVEKEAPNTAELTSSPHYETAQLETVEQRVELAT